MNADLYHQSHLFLTSLYVSRIELPESIDLFPRPRDSFGDPSVFSIHISLLGFALTLLHQSTRCPALPNPAVGLRPASAALYAGEQFSPHASRPARSVMCVLHLIYIELDVTQIPPKFTDHPFSHLRSYLRPISSNYLSFTAINNPSPQSKSIHLNYPPINPPKCSSPSSRPSFSAPSPPPSPPLPPSLPPLLVRFLHVPVYHLTHSLLT